MNIAQALQFCSSLQSSLRDIGREATQELRAPGFRPEDDDEAGWDALYLQEEQLLDGHSIQFNGERFGFREVEDTLDALHSRLKAGVQSSADVSKSDTATLDKLGKVLGERPPYAEMGWFVADLEAFPANSLPLLTQVLAVATVSLRMPSVSARVVLSTIELQTSQPTPQSNITLQVKFQARMQGRQGDSLAAFLALASARLALTHQGQREVPLLNVRQVADPVFVIEGEVAKKPKAKKRQAQEA